MPTAEPSTPHDSAAPTFTLKLNDVDDAVPGTWFVYRARATYVVGPPDCVERECEDYFDEHDNPKPGVTACTHLTAGIASVADAMGMEAVRRTLDYFESDIALGKKHAVEHPDSYTAADISGRAGKEEVVEALRHNIAEATE